MKTYNGFILANGNKIPFPLKLHEHIQVEEINIRNHPAFNAKKDSKCVVTTEDIPKDTYLGIYAGQVVSDEIDEWNPYQIVPSEDCDYFVDAQQTGNDLRFINDYRNTRKTANVGFMLYPKKVRGYFATVVVALRDLQKGEELLADYGEGYWEEFKIWTDNQNPFKCAECDYRTTTAHNLRMHKSRNHDVKVFIDCPHCDKQFADKQGLDGHLNLIYKRKLYKCPKCDYSTYIRSDIKKHDGRVHSQKTVYKCLQCEREFTANYRLRNHVDGVHDVKKRFSCDKCDYKSVCSSDIKRHVNGVHNRNKRFSCDECNFKTAYPSDVKRHKVNVHF